MTRLWYVCAKIHFKNEIAHLQFCKSEEKKMTQGICKDDLNEHHEKALMIDLELNDQGED